MNPDSSTPQTALAMTTNERMACNKEILLDALKHAGAIRAGVAYHGGGDEGTDQGAKASDAHNQAVDLSSTVTLFCERRDHEAGQWKISIAQQDALLDIALSDYAMEAVYQHHRGWENNEGGYGEVIFDCEAGTVRIEHFDYFVESEYTETVL